MKKANNPIPRIQGCKRKRKEANALEECAKLRKQINKLLECLPLRKQESWQAKLNGAIG